MAKRVGRSQPISRTVAALVAAFVVLGATAPSPANAGCHTRSCHTRVAVKHKQRTVAPYRSRLLSIAYCESGGRWHINTGNGFYGGLQFTLRSWWAVGGRGFPHRASPLEQMYRAVRLARVQGWGAWPVCG